MGLTLPKQSRFAGLLSIATLVLPGALVVSCNSSGGAAAPRVLSIPLQKAGGGTTFVLDLAAFVKDDTQTATYAVLSGGGAFTGSVYSRAFPTLGTYTVSFQVSDFRGEKATSEFKVRITSAELAVMRSGTGMSLLDAQTGNVAAALQSDGRTKTFKKALKNGAMVFEVVDSGQKDLWLHDPNVAGTDVFAGDSTTNETFVAITNDQRVVFQHGNAPNRALFVYDPLSKGTLPIAITTAGAGDQRNLMVGPLGLLYFEFVTSSKADIYRFDPATNRTTVVSKNAADERLSGILPDGSVVYRRLAAAGDWDLFHSKTTGTTEVATDLGASAGAESKTFRIGTTDSQITFETKDSGGDVDFYVWNPTTGKTATIANSSASETWIANTATGRVVYKVQAGSGNADIKAYDVSAGTSATVSASSDDEVFLASLADGDVIFSRKTGGALDLWHWDQATGTATIFPDAAATTPDQVFAKVLAGGDVVYAAGPSVSVYKPSTKTSTPVVTAAGTEAFAGATAGNDFVVSLVTGGNTHLYLWKSATSSAVAISTPTGTAKFEGYTASGLILFSVIPNGSTTGSLFSYAVATGATKQITNGSASVAVEAVVQALVQ